VLSVPAHSVSWLLSENRAFLRRWARWVGQVALMKYTDRYRWSKFALICSKPELVSVARPIWE